MSAALVAAYCWRFAQRAWGLFNDVEQYSNGITCGATVERLRLYDARHVSGLAAGEETDHA